MERPLDGLANGIPENAQERKELVDDRRTPQQEQQQQQQQLPLPNLAPGPNERVTINVSGLRFETAERTLARFPNTLLGDPMHRRLFHDPVHDEIFFDRHRSSFEAVLYYYQSGGMLKRPVNVPYNIFIKELAFYEMGQDTICAFKRSEGVDDRPPRPLPKQRLQRIVWELFEYPDTSMFAKCITILSLAMILVSIAAYCAETVPNIRDYGADQVDVFFIIETTCIIWFCFELSTRFMVSPDKLYFFKSVMNIVDLVAILPYFISLSTSDVHSKEGEDHTMSLTAFRVSRLLRVFRIFKLSRHSTGLQILGKTLHASLREIGVLILFLCIGIVIFSSAVFFLEGSEEFSSIPGSFWWAVVTMTTVGYGDMAPKSMGGRLVGSVCAVSGVLMIALPVPVIVSNFGRLYDRQIKRDASENDLEETIVMIGTSDKKARVESLV
uniref:potassium voltage-gated channel subfamily A member 2-like n=1 Tax=Myxine glutinosa TaxID=7769 RepID=UPI00358FF2DD